MGASRVYVPGAPGNTEYVKQLWLIAGLIERPTSLYLTATHYGAVIAELLAQHGAPSTQAPASLQFGVPEKEQAWERRVAGDRQSHCLMVINSGTDDEAEVNRKNRDTPGAIDFQSKVLRLRVA